MDAQIEQCMVVFEGFPSPSSAPDALPLARDRPNDLKQWCALRVIPNDLALTIVVEAGDQRVSVEMDVTSAAELIGALAWALAEGRAASESGQPGENARQPNR